MNSNEGVNAVKNKRQIYFHLISICWKLQCPAVPLKVFDLFENETNYV